MSFATSLVRSAFDLLGFEIRRRHRIRIAELSFDGSLADRVKSLSDRFKMYHIGCGVAMVDGFLNIDAGFEYGQQSGKLYALCRKPSTYILEHDVKNGIPAASESLEVIYHSHFFEHLTDHEGIGFLSEFHRSLVSGGLMRFAVPDFNLWCSNYISGNNEFFNWYRKAYLSDNTLHYKTNALVFMGMLYNWGHRMACDYESLTERLVTIGFTKIRRADWGISEKIRNIALFEEPQSQRRVESLVVECTKQS